MFKKSGYTSVLYLPKIIIQQPNPLMQHNTPGAISMKLANFLKGGKQERKVFFLGIDSAVPDLVFSRWRDDLPNLNYLADHGISGKLESSFPAITVPAWTSMLSGRDPGELGIYGFRNRADHSYDNMFIATSGAVRERRIWDYLSQAGRQSMIMGVPQTYPTKPILGNLVSGFLTPDTGSNFTFPSTLRNEVLQVVPDYDFDVRNFRTDRKDWLLEQLTSMMERRYQLVDHLLQQKTWDFFMLMEIGIDRLQHGFWSYFDPEHRRYSPGNPYENAIHDAYIRIDRKLGEWMNMIGEDTIIIVASDHGAKRMDGGICINEWLWKNGYLAFKQDPPSGTLTRLQDLEIDWEKTTAWGSGGYYGRVFLNVKKREPQGTVDPSDTERVRKELADRISRIPDDQGRLLNTEVGFPEDRYHTVNGVAPDLMIYFGDLHWRSVGTLGHGSFTTLENDTGPDDCNHGQMGIAIYHDPRNKKRTGTIRDAQLMDMTPTLLETFGLDTPANVHGMPLWNRAGLK